MVDSKASFLRDINDNNTFLFIHISEGFFRWMTKYYHVIMAQFVVYWRHILYFVKGWPVNLELWQRVETYNGGSSNVIYCLKLEYYAPQMDKIFRHLAHKPPTKSVSRTLRKWTDVIGKEH